MLKIARLSKLAQVVSWDKSLDRRRSPATTSIQSAARRGAREDAYHPLFCEGERPDSAGPTADISGRLYIPLTRRAGFPPMRLDVRDDQTAGHDVHVVADRLAGALRVVARP